MGSMELATKAVLKSLLGSSLKSDNKEELAKTIDKVATELLEKFKKEYSEEFLEILEGFQDFHHWGNDELGPTYTLKDVEKIYSHL